MLKLARDAMSSATAEDWAAAQAKADEEAHAYEAAAPTGGACSGGGAAAVQHVRAVQWAPCTAGMERCLEPAGLIACRAAARARACTA